MSTELRAYVDGSYNKTTKQVGGGIVLITITDLIITDIIAEGILCGDSNTLLTNDPNDSEFISMHQIGGEINAALTAMQLASNMNLPITIFYEYLGIEKWATGKWKTNKFHTQLYKDLVDKLSKSITIDFIKVPAHTGNTFNEVADAFAKFGCKAISDLTLKRILAIYGFDIATNVPIVRDKAYHLVNTGCEKI